VAQPTINKYFINPNDKGCHEIVMTPFLIAFVYMSLLQILYLGAGVNAFFDLCQSCLDCYILVRVLNNWPEIFFTDVLFYFCCVIIICLIWSIIIKKLLSLQLIWQNH